MNFPRSRSFRRVTPTSLPTASLAIPPPSALGALALIARCGQAAYGTRCFSPPVPTLPTAVRAPPRTSTARCRNLGQPHHAVQDKFAVRADILTLHNPVCLLASEFFGNFAQFKFLHLAARGAWQVF